MSINRYIAVCHSFSAKLRKFRKKSSVIVIIICVWIIALLSCTPVIENTKIQENILIVDASNFTI